MKKGYYPPEIEEFHVGFKCELKLHELKDWEIHIVLPADKLDIQKYIDKQLIRVKHLDRKDIESFGWKYIRTRFGISMIFRGFVDERICNIKIMFNVRSNWLMVYNENDTVRFSGEINNKNEFGKLMKQLKIKKNEQLSKVKEKE